MTAAPPTRAPAPSPKVVDWDTLLARRAEHRAAGRTVVWTNGCFDLLHPGHVLSLRAAKRLGDVLVVGVNSDESVRGLKGPGRPILTAAERVEVLAALECVDHVVVFAEPTPEAALTRLRPDVHCKGPDYAPPHGKPVPEAAAVAAYGGRIEYLPFLPAVSTSELIRRIRGRPDVARSERPAVFLDRDGTIIHDAGYPRDPEQVRFLPGVGEALRELAGRGLLLVLVSNQSGIGRGLVRPDEAERVHARVVAGLAERGVRLDAAYYCPHGPDEGCDCRKPAPGMLLRAAESLAIDRARSFVVGDKPSDVEAGARAGCRTVLLTAQPPARAASPEPHYVAADWPAALRCILNRAAGEGERTL